MSRKPILCLDFDGVCHSYFSGWQGVDNIPDPPVPGLFEFILEASHSFDVQIFSSRSAWPEGLTAMKVWFAKHYAAWLESLDEESLDKYYNYAISINNIVSFPNHKPPAVISLDDRAVTFTGSWPAIDYLREFQPWTKGTDDLTEYDTLKRELSA